MKRYGNLYEKIYDIDNLRLAHANARKDKTFYKEVKKVDSDVDFYLLQIQEMLINKTYEVGEYKISTINDKGKERELYKLPYFPDRIIQWAILLQTEPIFLKVLMPFTCASLKKRGIHKASKMLDEYLKDRKGTEFCLKIDIKKFYQNIDHDILKRLLMKKFKDKDLLWIMFLVVDSFPCDKGIPIGSYLSQYFANFYLAYFDHWIKEEMKVKYVIRYMDDVVFLHSSKEFLHELKISIEKYLDSELNLQLKSNWQVFPTDIRGIDFVGYRHFYDYKLLRKSTCKNFKQKMLRILKKCENQESLSYRDWCCVNSYRGWIKWCNGNRLTDKYISPLQSYLDDYYETQIKSKKKETEVVS